MLSPPARVRIDLRPPRPREGPSEFALIEARVREGLAAGATGLDGADESVVDEVAEWLDIDAERLSVLQEARALEAETGIPAPVFYAVSRSSVGSALEELLEVPLADLRATIDEAIADRIVDAAAVGDLDAVVPRLADAIVERCAPRRRRFAPGWWRSTACTGRRRATALGRAPQQSPP